MQPIRPHSRAISPSEGFAGEAACRIAAGYALTHRVCG
jgi:hypothetical protein